MRRAMHLAPPYARDVGFRLRVRGKSVCLRMRGRIASLRMRAGGGKQPVSASA